MKAYPFGQDITYDFYPRDVDGDVVSPSADAPTIYLFDARPDRAAAAAGTDAIQTISAWSTVGNAQRFTITAVADPEPESLQNTRRYWLGVNYTLVAAGDTVTTIVEIPLSRPLGYDTELEVLAADLEVRLSNIDGYELEAQQTAVINAAIQQVRFDLEANRFEWYKIRNIEDLKIPVIERSLYIIALGQIVNQEDLGWQRMVDESRTNYDEMIGKLRLRYDREADSQKDSEVTQGFFSYQVT